jgi:hypothetical protein
MALHLVKLCVGVASAADLRSMIGDAPRGKPVRHTTRMTPTRGPEIVGKGSLYWVMRGRICARQAVLGLEPFVDPAGTGRCRILLSPEVVDVETRPRKMFQGWRYLAAEDAPRDLGDVGSDLDAMPDAMRRELAGLGLL